MKIYNTKTIEDYIALMIELESKGYKWLSGVKPTSKDYWSEDKENACIKISGEDITSASLDFYKEHYPNKSIIEYKAKGETKMTNEEMKRKLQKNAFDVYVAVDIFAVRGISESEKDLQEAKSSAKKLIEKIDEYLEYLKPKFKVGDYVTDTSGNNPYICKIEEFEGHAIVGNWYCFKDNHLDKSIVLPISTSRLSTSEEIAEYKTALNFYKHGRDPFEVKKGDLIRTPSEKFTLILYPENYTKEEFLDYGWEFLKTVEEVSEWSGADDE